MLRVLRATELANELHSGQKRRSGEAYISHPVAVSYLVAHYKRSAALEDLLIAALLHDVVEDCDYPIHKITEEFGGVVGGLVQELTNDEAAIEKLGKEAYQLKKMVGMSSYALVIKLCDRLHNVSCNPGEKMVQATINLCLNLVNMRMLSKTHQRIIVDIMSECRKCEQK